MVYIAVAGVIHGGAYFRGLTAFEELSIRLDSKLLKLLRTIKKTFDTSRNSDL